MELKLSLPTYPPVPEFVVETRPKQVQEWLEALPLANTHEACRKLADAIAAVNSVKLGEDARCNLLEIYRTAVSQLRPSLQQLYVGKPLPLAEKSQQAVMLLREMYGELANGYKLALMDLSARRGNLSANKLTALALGRVLECLGNMLEVYYEAYAPAPAAIWTELHQVYWYAAKLNLHDQTLASEEKNSINTIYTQILLIALADPYRMLQGQLVLVKAYLAQFGRQVVLQSLGPTDNKHGLFLVRLDSDYPPKALMHYQGVTDARTDIILNTIPLARVLHQHVQGLESGLPLLKLGLPEGAQQASYRDMLKRLIKQWGVAPKRVFNRAQGHVDVHVCAGIYALHRALSEGLVSADIAHKDAPENIALSDLLQATGNQQTYNCTRWNVLNESAGGLTLAKEAGHYAKIKVGDIVGIEAETAGSWEVALVRWMQSDADHRIELGAQRLAPHAEAIAVKPVIAAADALFQPALLLPEIPALKQPARIAAARGSFQHLREFEVRSHGLIHQVRANLLIEQTDGLDLFTFN